MFDKAQIFKKEYPIAQCYLIYSGDHVEKHNDLTALPIQQALFKLEKILKCH